MARGDSKPSAALKKTTATGKKSTARTTASAKSPDESSSIPLELQQKCLNIFHDTLQPSSDDSSILQEVKGHLYNRDFAAAFGKQEYLRVYASRWSPSRALAYLDIFADLASRIESSLDGVDVMEGSCMRVVCLGGGAGGELVGLGGWMSTLSAADQNVEKQRLQVDLVDIADWSAVVQNLQVGLTTPPELSSYASQAKKDANAALVPGPVFVANFHQLDALSSMEGGRDKVNSLLEKADLVTFMFTLNELYSTSLPATKALLNRLTHTMRAGAHLLVVDSPGSYSTVSLNGAEKKYPMQWLLDHTLLGSASSNGEGAEWRKVVEDETRWFRLSKELKYPIALEDMRYQMHLYRRV